MDKQQGISGLDLAREFFEKVVQRILDARFPRLEYSAALIGSGSEVLGFDTEMSRDHHWGPRAMLFLQPEDYTALNQEISATFSDHLPHTFHGYPTNFTQPDPNDNGTQQLSLTTSGPVNHRVELYTLPGYFESYFGINVHQELTPSDWLTLPQQKLRAVTAGAVFRDEIGLEALRTRFRWYPHDVWLYVLASCWARIGQEEHLMGRAGFAGDEIGSALIGARLVRDLMRLAFLMERSYPPYPKWFGTAFSRLSSARALEPALTATLTAATWQIREQALCEAYRIAAEIHNKMALTEPLPTIPTRFFGRPFQVIHADAFAGALLAQISDPAVNAIARSRPIGSIDLFSDSTDLLEDSGRRRPLLALYQ